MTFEEAEAMHRLNAFLKKKMRILPVKEKPLVIYQNNLYYVHFLEQVSDTSTITGKFHWRLELQSLFSKLGFAKDVCMSKEELAHMFKTYAWVEKNYPEYMV